MANPKEKALEVAHRGDSAFRKHKEIIGGKVGLRMTGYSPEHHREIDKKYDKRNSEKGLTPTGKRKSHFYNTKY